MDLQLFIDDTFTSVADAKIPNNRIAYIQAADPSYFGEHAAWVLVLIDGNTRVSPAVNIRAFSGGGRQFKTDPRKEILTTNLSIILVNAFVPDQVLDTHKISSAGDLVLPTHINRSRISLASDYTLPTYVNEAAIVQAVEHINVTNNELYDESVMLTFIGGHELLIPQTPFNEISDTFPILG